MSLSSAAEERENNISLFLCHHWELGGDISLSFICYHTEILQSNKSLFLVDLYKAAEINLFCTKKRYLVEYRCEIMF